MTYLQALALFVLASQWHTSAGPPIIRRHDVPDSLYLQLGATFTSVAHLYLPTPKGAADGEGTLIHPRWVLTAAHVAAGIRHGHRVTIGDDVHLVDSIVLHPDWEDGGPNDIALLRLATPVRAIQPAVVYRDSAEAGREIVIVGYGDIGTGLTGPQSNDRRVRGATNRVDEASAYWLKFLFDAPDSRGTTSLEGVSGPGDSGGPAYLRDAGREVIVGVSSGQSSRATGGRPGRYGVTEYYTRVSRYVDWIESVTGPLPMPR